MTKWCPQPAQVPVLREYALLADGYRGAVVGPDGAIAWLCAPVWESPSIFSNLLGGRGRYVVAPTWDRFVWGGYYEPESLIWVSRWVTAGGVIESREALACPASERRLVLLRQIRTFDQAAAVQVLLDPAAGYGRAPLRGLRRDGGVWSGRTAELHLRLTGGAGLAPSASGALQGSLELAAGGRHDLVLEVSVDPITGPVAPAEFWRSTEHAWRRSAVPPVADGVAHRDAAFARAVLRGLTRPGGGMVAAATMGLPERAHSGRNYDYRYAWIRDQCLAGQAAAAAGATDLLDDAVAFITDRVLADGPRLEPAYTTGGGAVPRQEDLDFLPGYPGARVGSGNWVRDQFQLDVFGEVLLLLAAAARLDRAGPDLWHGVQVAVDAIAARWREPDSGIWELPARQWTHSKLSCVAGLRAVARLAPSGLAPARPAARWAGLADTILADVGVYGLHPSGRWRQTYDGDRVDAALLLPAVRGALPPDDPRTVATRRAVMDELECDGYLYRFRPDSRPLGDAEGAFLLCGFIAALDAYRAGDVVAANRWFERSRAACGTPGLYTEEYDVRQRQLRGNLPQAFVHALLLETATVLSQG